MLRYQKRRGRSAGVQLVQKSHFSSPAAQEALRELARCFARTAVDAMIAELESRALPDPPSSGAPTAIRDVAAPWLALPETGFLRIRDIIGDRRRGMPGLIPMSPATWYSWINTQRAPKPVKLGRTSVWRAEDIRALIERLSSQTPINSPSCILR
jgi:predicted DNA-binding transcriptional regulator AlpA